MVLPMDSILQTGMLVLFTNPTATELFGMAARVRMLSEMLLERGERREESEGAYHSG